MICYDCQGHERQTRLIGSLKVKESNLKRKTRSDSLIQQSYQALPSSEIWLFLLRICFLPIPDMASSTFRESQVAEPLRSPTKRVSQRWSRSVQIRSSNSIHHISRCRRFEFIIVVRCSQPHQFSINESIAVINSECDPEISRELFSEFCVFLVYGYPWHPMDFQWFERCNQPGWRGQWCYHELSTEAPVRAATVGLNAFEQRTQLPQKHSENIKELQC